MLPLFPKQDLCDLPGRATPPLMPWHARMLLYILSTERLLELAREYVQEMGYILSQQGTIVGTDATIASGERTQVAVPVGNERPPVVITITLRSSGDLRLVADTETFLTPSSEDTVR